jgi:hypothetical protein
MSITDVYTHCNNTYFYLHRITFDETPECLTPGKPWSITVKTHVGSAKTVDWRTNLQKGSGPNKYLGEKDSFGKQIALFLSLFEAITVQDCRCS